VKWNNVLGGLFPVLCGVRQGGVLTPVLFALHIDGVISELKLSGHGVHDGSLFIFILTTLCCCQLSAIVCNSFLIFVMYMAKWDIKFNPFKSQSITFGGQNLCGQIMLNGNQIPWVNKVKYLGVHFCCNTDITDLSHICRKFY